MAMPHKAAGQFKATHLLRGGGSRSSSGSQRGLLGAELLQARLGALQRRGQLRNLQLRLLQRLHSLRIGNKNPASVLSCSATSVCNPMPPFIQ